MNLIDSPLKLNRLRRSAIGPLAALLCLPACGRERVEPSKPPQTAARELAPGVAAAHVRPPATSVVKSEEQVSARVDGPFELVVLGEYLPYKEDATDETNAKWWKTAVNKRWLAICPQAGLGVRLVETAVRLAPTKWPDSSDFNVQADGCPAAVALVRGLPPRSAALDTAIVESLPPDGTRGRWAIGFSGKRLVLEVQDELGSPVVLKVEGSSMPVLDWRAEAARWRQSEPTRTDWGEASNLEVLWAGDLNGDGSLDLLLKYGDAELGVAAAFYLSGPNGLLTLADTFAWGGC